MKFYGLAIVAVALSACAPTVPDSAAGVGFSDYNDYDSYRSYRATREAELRGGGVTTIVPTATATLPPAETVAVTPLDATPTNASPTPVNPNNPAISDEQNFNAVANRQSIESDAERLKAQREAYKVIEPTAVPTRPDDGPNIVAYALRTKNARGQQMYRRFGIGAASRSARNCAKYSSPDLAQEAFLAAGGPEKDRMTLDPDGDGFACGWDPTPFRRVANG